MPIDDKLPCEAFTDWPEGTTICGVRAVFEVERVADTNLLACAEHLGPLLQHAVNVLWPPVVKWTGEGQKPENSVAAGADAEKRPRRL